MPRAGGFVPGRARSDVLRTLMWNLTRRAGTMPYVTHWEDEGVRWVFSGFVTDDDLLRCNLEAYGDPRFESLRYEIADFRAVEDFSAGPETVKRVARMDRDQSVRNPRVKVAILATAAVIKGTPVDTPIPPQPGPRRRVPCESRG